MPITLGTINSSDCILPSQIESRWHNCNVASIDEGKSCYPIYKFGKNIELKNPIHLEISLEDGEYTGKILELGIYDYSETLKDLIDSVKDYLNILYKEYSKSDNSILSPELILQKKALLSNIKK